MLKNLTPSIHQLIPSLLGGAHFLQDAYVAAKSEHPNAQVLRPLHAQSSTLATYVIPATFPENPRRWYPEEPSTYPLREGNELEYLIDGQNTFEAMVEAIETATGPEHFIVLLGWAAHFDFQLSKEGARAPGATRTGAEVLEERVKLGVRVRLLLWKNDQLNDTDGTGNYYCKLSKIVADGWNVHAPPDESPRRVISIIDGATRPGGSHHQKILLVFGAEGLIGFFGGIDFNSDRVRKERLPVPFVPGVLNIPHIPIGTPVLPVDGPLHDVHARVRGPSALDLLALAVKRWNHAEPADVSQPFDRLEKRTRGYWDPNLAGRTTQAASGKEIEDLTHLVHRAIAKPVVAPTPHRFVRIAQTVGNPRLATTESTKGVAMMILGAIRKARRFIYVEDQYLWSVPAMSAILERVSVVSHVTLLTPPDSALSFVVHPGLTLPRHAALRALLDQAKQKGLLDLVKKKVRIYERVGGSHSYIHAKAGIYDDEFAVVGSANWNDRGFSYDSEVVGGISDAPWDSISGARYGAWHTLELDFARKLRMSLWNEHLGLPTDQLLDGVASEFYWRNPPAGAMIRPYLVGGREWFDSQQILECDYKQNGALDVIFDPDDEMKVTIPSTAGT